MSDRRDPRWAESSSHLNFPEAKQSQGFALGEPHKSAQENSLKQNFGHWHIHSTQAVDEPRQTGYNIFPSKDGNVRLTNPDLSDRYMDGPVANIVNSDWSDGDAILTTDGRFVYLFDTDGTIALIEPDLSEIIRVDDYSDRFDGTDFGSSSGVSFGANCDKYVIAGTAADDLDAEIAVFDVETRNEVKTVGFGSSFNFKRKQVFWIGPTLYLGHEVTTANDTMTKIDFDSGGTGVESFAPFSSGEEVYKAVGLGRGFIAMVAANDHAELQIREVKSNDVVTSGNLVDYGGTSSFVELHFDPITDTLVVEQWDIGNGVWDLKRLNYEGTELDRITFNTDDLTALKTAYDGVHFYAYNDTDLTRMIRMRDFQLVFENDAPLMPTNLDATTEQNQFLPHVFYAHNESSNTILAYPTWTQSAEAVCRGRKQFTYGNWRNTPYAIRGQ